MKIILISGKAEAGKTTAAKYIKKKLELMDFRVANMSYGSILKMFAKEVYNWDGTKSEDGRKLLQHLGTEVVRKHNPRFWTDILKEFGRIMYVSRELDYIIIDDVRFLNEITCWDDVWTETVEIRIERPGHENSLTEEQRTHESETALDNYTYWNYIISAVNLTDLYSELDTIIGGF